MFQALIIFVRNPEKGKVKTRIAAVAGEDAALAVYKKLLQHTYDITCAITCDKYVYYADALGINDLWSNGSYNKALQSNSNLGNRMHHAFEQTFNKGYSKVCIIGSDCYELSQSMIEQAFHWLDAYDVVIGPAMDGGYYLLAMRNKATNIFENIAWSTDAVLAQTLALIKKEKLSYTLLQYLNDVDAFDDVPKSWKDELALNIRNK